MPTSATPVVPSVIVRTHQAIQDNRLQVGQYATAYWLKLDDNGRLVFDEYPMGGSQISTPIFRGDFGATQIAELLREREALLISSELNPDHTCVALPISLFSAPLGFLVMSLEEWMAADPMVHLFSNFSTLFNIAHDCLEERIRTDFTTTSLLKIGSVSNLRNAYCGLISEWLNPCKLTYQTPTEEPVEGNGHTTAAFGEKACELHINLSYGLEPLEAVFELSSFRLTRAGQLLHEDPNFSKLKKRCAQKLSKLFQRLVQEWTWCHYQEIARQVQRLNALRARLKTALDDDSGRSREGVYPAPELPPQLEKPDFAWYKTGGDIWVIRFAGQDIQLNHNFKQGMVAIHQLLSCPNERIEWHELYLVLRQSGVTYDDTDDLERIDPYKVKQDYLTLKDELISLKQHRVETSARVDHQSAYWLKYFAIADALTTHNWHEWRQDRGLAKKKLNDLNWSPKSIPLTLEMIFETYEGFKRFRFDNNKTESIRKGIRSAINAYEQFPPLQEYLTQTLLLTRKPFAFEPERCSNPEFRSIRWQTAAVQPPE